MKDPRQDWGPDGGGPGRVGAQCWERILARGGRKGSRLPPLSGGRSASCGRAENPPGGTKTTQGEEIRKIRKRGERRKKRKAEKRKGRRRRKEKGGKESEEKGKPEKGKKDKKERKAEKREARKGGKVPPHKK